jgi:integrase
VLLRHRRAARRRQTVAAATVVPGLSFLEQASVRPATRQNYERALERFHGFALDNGLDVASTFSLDEALVEFMNQAFLDGERSYLGNTLLAALSFSRPGLGRPKEMPLPRAKQALRGWRRMAPAAGRLPLVWELVCGMAMHFIAVGRSDLAFAMLIQTVFYLRPSELLRLRVGSVTAPNRLASASHHRWAISLHDFESETSTPSKTGEFDEGLQLDLPRYQFLGSVLRRLTADRDARAPLVSLEPTELATAMKEVAEVTRVPFRVFPYQLRHTGASTDFSTGDRLIADIKRRGRWRADQSTRRYERASQLTRLLQSIPEPALSYCLEAARTLPSVIYGRSEAVAFRGR